MLYFTLLLSLFICLLAAPPKKKPSDVITSFNPGGQYILLTFEDGPHPIITPKLLDVLKEKKARVTFFTQASNGVNYPEILQRSVNEKHEIGCHGWNKDNIMLLSSEKRIEQINKSVNLLENIIKRTIQVIRPPNAINNNEFNSEIKSSTNMKIILSNIDSNDLEINDINVIIKNIMIKVKPGDIIVFHEKSPHIVQLISQLVDELYKKGYETLTLSEVLSFPDDSPHR